MSDESLARCGRIINPPALKIRSTGADEAGEKKASEVCQLHYFVT